MSSQLITQLRALETSLNEEAQKLQGLVNKGKEKAKHYRAITEEARNLASRYVCRIYISSFRPLLNVHPAGEHTAEACEGEGESWEGLDPGIREGEEPTKEQQEKE